MIEPLLYVSTFVAGILMFLAPCTLPLLPAYLGFISGVTERELAELHGNGIARRSILKNALLFVIGFSTIFIFFGTLAGFAGAALVPVRNVLEILGGILITIFGLFLLGVLNVRMLRKTRTVHLPSFLTVGTPLGAYFLGAAFALGWSPCIGPILGTVLFLAGSTGTLLQGVVLLVIFSLGFALPFLLLALLISQATRIVEKATPYLSVVSKIGGVTLVILGVYLTLGDTMLTRWFFDIFQYLDFEESLLPYL